MLIGLLESGQVVRKEAIPAFAATYEVVVVGLGTAGVEALLDSAERGVKTLGIDLRGGLGGNSTLGCVNFAPKWPNNVPANLCRLERRAARSGAELAYETAVIGVWLEGNTVCGLKVCRNGMVRDVAAKIVIDATGSATVARMAGTEVTIGRAFDGAQFTVSKTYLFETPNGVHPAYCGVCDNPAVGMADYAQLVANLNRRALRLRGRTHSRVLVAASTIGAREEAHVVTDRVLTFRECLFAGPTDKPVFTTWTPFDMHRADKDWAFESEDAVTWSVLCGLHSFAYPAAIPYETLLPKGVDGMLVPSRHFGIDHDAFSGIRLNPEMRLTGRVASAAASLAVEQGIKLRQVKYADLRKLLDESNLIQPVRAGVNYYGEPHFEPFTDAEIVVALRRDVTPAISWVFAHPPDENDRAAYAYFLCWDAKVRGDRARRTALGDALAGEMLTGEPRYAGNFAVALALLGDARAAEVLLDIVCNPGAQNALGRDPLVDCSYPNRIKALRLLGQLGGKAAMRPLADILADGAKQFTADLHKLQARTGEYPGWVYPFDGTMASYRFAALSMALFALASLLQRYPDPAIVDKIRTRITALSEFPQIAAAIEKLFS